MKIIAALLSRFSRQKTDKPDVFDQRLRSMTTPASKKRRPQREVAPVLFRRNLGHA